MMSSGLKDILISRRLIKKIVIIGTTGSGKTTFFTNLTGLSIQDLRSEVNRNIFLEDQVNDDFTTIDKGDFVNSTTTVSMNAHGIYFAHNKANQFKKFGDLSSLETNLSELDCLYPVQLIDTAGQERFNFMVEILLNGADGVIILSDGSNMSSIEKVSFYLDTVKRFESRMGHSIPTIVCINKADLKEKGLYVGKDAITRWLNNDDIPVYETTNKNPESFTIPLIELFSKINGFPINISSLSKVVAVNH